jgi:hypothetical protein
MGAPFSREAKYHHFYRDDRGHVFRGQISSRRRCGWAKTIPKPCQETHGACNLPSGYLTVRHGIDGPFIDGLPIKNGDFPWLC